MDDGESCARAVDDSAAPQKPRHISNEMRRNIRCISTSQNIRLHDRAKITEVTKGRINSREVTRRHVSKSILFADLVRPFWSLRHQGHQIVSDTFCGVACDFAFVKVVAENRTDSHGFNRVQVGDDL